MLESGEFASITDLAKAEKINHAYVRRLLRLTLLSPTIIEEILDNGFASGRDLDVMLKASWYIWAEQAGQLGEEGTAVCVLLSAGKRRAGSKLSSGRFQHHQGVEGKSASARTPSNCDAPALLHTR
jgi:hypothetical protein